MSSLPLAQQVPRIALTGATGFLGGAVLEEALARGLVVDALTRRDQPRRDGVTWMRGDLADRDALDEIMLGAEVAIHVAGVVNAPGPAEFVAGNVDGTLAALEAAKAAGVPRFVFVSSLSAREPQLSAYGASKARAELLVKASGLDWTIVRPPWIYGPGDRDTLDMFKAARIGVVPVPGGGGRASMIHVHDLARLLLDLIPGGEYVTHRVFEPDDGRARGWSHVEIAHAMGKAVSGRRALALQLPPFAMRAAARVDRALRGRRAKLTADRVGYMLHPNWVVSATARPPRAIWRPMIATPEGLTQTAEWYREAGWL